MKRKFPIVHSGLAWVYGATVVTGVVLGACISEPDYAPTSCSTPTCTELAVDGSVTGAGGTAGGPGGGKGGAGGGLETGGAGGAGGGGPEPPTFPDGGTDTLSDGSVPSPPEEDASLKDAGADDAGFAPTCDGLEMKPVVVYISADDSNSMGSPGHVRETLNIGFEPSPSRIRTYEFLNYYQMPYDAPDYEKLGLVPEIELIPETSKADFQLGVRSYNALPQRRPMNITFLVDTSGSMKGPGIERAQAAVKAIATQLVAGDTVSLLTTTDTTEKVKGRSVVGPNDPVLTNEVDKLVAGGSSDLNSSLAKAYLIADQFKDIAINRMSRVVLISDGGANVGITDTSIIAQHSADADREGIYLVGIGTGPALSYNDALMNKVTEAGRGAYVYLDTVGEAQKILADRFDETMDIAARSVQVELTLPWYFAVKGESIEGPPSSTPVDPQHLAPNDAMVFLLQTTACDPNVYNRSDNVRVRVSWRTPITYQSRASEINVPLNSLVGTNLPRIAKSRAIVAFAEALKGCGFDAEGKTLCKDETERKDVTKMKLISARKLAEKAPADADISQIIGLIDTHPLMQ
ncbi:MAG TPA: VWA domain-containing protein [Polyangium sp.]|nr:VWA domain-containing protein [Polyangium sp.]